MNVLRALATASIVSCVAMSNAANALEIDFDLYDYKPIGHSSLFGYYEWNKYAATLGNGIYSTYEYSWDRGLEDMYVYRFYDEDDAEIFTISSDLRFGIFYIGPPSDLRGPTSDFSIYQEDSWLLGYYGAQVRLADLGQWVDSEDGFFYDFDIVGGHIVTVPEPETYAMLLAGLGLVGAAARRRRELNRR